MYCCPVCSPRWRNINENARSLIGVYGYCVLVRLVNVADQRVGDHVHAIRFGCARRHREWFLKSSPLTPNGVHPAKRHFFQWKTCVFASGRPAGGRLGACYRWIFMSLFFQTIRSVFMGKRKIKMVHNIVTVLSKKINNKQNIDGCGPCGKKWIRSLLL